MKACAFTTCNDAYVPHAVLALKSVMRWAPDFTPIIVGRQFSQEMKSLMSQHGVEAMEVDFSAEYPQAWQYPVECFYWFSAPTLLLEAGFSHALYLDADVYCNADPTDQLSTVAVLAGVSAGSLRDILGSDTARVESEFGPVADVERIQSGVVLINLPAYADLQLRERAASLFAWSVNNGVPRKGDDSLLALLLATSRDLSPEYLPRPFNVIVRQHGQSIHEVEWLTAESDLIHEAVFFHFTARTEKPWLLSHQFPNYVSKFFSGRWIRHAIDTLDAVSLARYFPRIAERLTDKHLRFYWWGDRNVGDLVTAYYLQKSGVSETPELSRISEQDISRIDRWAKVADRLPLGAGRRLRAARYIVSTGSVVRLCGTRSLVFGSGIRSADQATRAANIRFVRGPLTRQRYIDSGHECPTLYGDPGLLMPRFFSPEVEKRYELAFLPHFTEYATWAERFAGESRILVIDMGSGDLEGVIRQLLACRRSVSSSLHGLIFSHAYNIPTRHVVLDGSIFGDGTKFRDYYLSLGREARSVDLSNPSTIELEYLVSIADEMDVAFDDRRILDEMFVTPDGLRPSARYPF